MNPMRTGFVSGRVRVIPPLSADVLRYSYLNLENTEPNLGVPNSQQPSFQDYILTSGLTGNRNFKTTFIWDSTYTTFRSSSANFLTKQQADLRYYQLTGGRIEGDVFVQGNIVATGGVSALSATYILSNITSFSSLSVFSFGIEPALLVGSQGGNFDIARFLDSDNGFPIFSIQDTYGFGTGRGRVGVNTILPTTDFTVNGSVSTNGIIYFDRYSTLDIIDDISNSKANSGKWESNYTTTSTLSSDWSSTNTIPIITRYLSGNRVVIGNLTVVSGLSVLGGLSADRIFGVFQNNVIQRFSGDGVTTVWQLSSIITSKNDILVYIGGIYQDKVTYDITQGPPSFIQFTEPPPPPTDFVLPLIDNDNVEIVFLTPNPLPAGQVNDGSITEQKLADRSVTSKKLASNLTIVGNLSVTGTLSAAGYVLTNSFIPYQSFNVSSNQTRFNLLCAAASINDINVYISGVYQHKDTYSLANQYTLDLTQAPPVGNGMLEVTYNRPFPAVSFYPSANSVVAGSVAPNAINTINLSAQAVTNDKMAENSVTTINISANCITTTKLALCAVNTRHLSALAVTFDKIAPNAINTINLSAGAVTFDKVSQTTRQALFSMSLIFS